MTQFQMNTKWPATHCKRKAKPPGPKLIMKKVSMKKCIKMSLGEMCHTLYLCLYLYFILEGLGLGFNLKLSENYSKIIKGPGVVAVMFFVVE